MMYMGSYNPEFPTTLSGLTGWYTGDSVVGGNPMTAWSDLLGSVLRLATGGGARIIWGANRAYPSTNTADV